jgi:hypothetical protein
MAIEKTSSRMKSLIILACIALALPQRATPQSFSPGLFSIDVPTDPRSIAMGESFVAVRGNPNALMYNPAGLSGIEGASFDFARRNLNHMQGLNSLKYFSYSATLSTPFADFGLLYSRYHHGEYAITTSADPEGDFGSARSYDYTFGIGAAIEIVKGLNAGLAVKTFKPVVTITEGTAPANLPEYTMPILFDIGLIQTLEGKLRGTQLDYAFSLGASLQNFGTDLKAKSPNLMLGRTTEMVLTLPRTLRTGIALEVSTPPLEGITLSPVSILITGEYRFILNSLSDPKTKIWGFGAEVTVLEILSARFGAFTPDYTSIYGVEDNPSPRFGLGVKAPLGLMGIGAPLTLSVDYVAIPLNTRFPYGFGGFMDKDLLNGFSIGLSYNADVFTSAE